MSDTWWVAAALALPFIYPLFVKAGAASWFKFAVSLAASIVVAVVSTWPTDTNPWTADTAATRVAAFVGVVQVTYKTADLVVQAWLDDQGKGLNDAAVYRPERGADQTVFDRR